MVIDLGENMRLHQPYFKICFNIVIIIYSAQNETGYWLAVTTP